ncbi:MAG: EamA family transporter [Phascolarctobacterium sp.]|nr:EamA family transporter [Candidatus Phascolarctobacterium caballi]
MSIYHLYIILSACLWGSIGIYVRLLTGSGLTSQEIVVCRAIGASILFLTAILFIDKNYLRVKLKHLWIFFASGCICFVGFSYCNFVCIELSSLGVASLLEYTAPIFVMLLSIFFLHEQLTKYKLLALATSFLGCVCITGALEENVTVNMAVIGFGLASGIGYALYSFFCKLALNHGYHPLTVTAYNFFFCTLGSFLLTSNIAFYKLTFDGWLGLAGLVILCSLFASLLYNKGLMGVDAGHASILATIEPFFASMIGFLLYDETLSITKLIGMVLILGSIILLNIKRSK